MDNLKNIVTLSGTNAYIIRLKASIYNSESDLEEVLKDTLAVDKLLCNYSSNSKHGKTAVVEFLVANCLKFFGIGRLQAKRIEANISVHIILLQLSKLPLTGIGLTIRFPP